MTNATKTRRSTRQQNTRTVGTVLGETLRIQEWQRTSTADCSAPDPVIWLGRRRLALDTGSFPPPLARALPRGWGLASAAEWKLFLQIAIVRGLLR